MVWLHYRSRFEILQRFEPVTHCRVWPGRKARYRASSRFATYLGLRSLMCNNTLCAQRGGVGRGFWSPCSGGRHLGRVVWWLDFHHSRVQIQVLWASWHSWSNQRNARVVSSWGFLWEDLVEYTAVLIWIHWDYRLSLPVWSVQIVLKPAEIEAYLSHSISTLTSVHYAGKLEVPGSETVLEVKIGKSRSTRSGARTIFIDCSCRFAPSMTVVVSAKTVEHRQIE